MTSLIVTSLRETGPCLSSVLVEEMLKTQGVNRDTARKQILDWPPESPDNQYHLNK